MGKGSNRALFPKMGGMRGNTGGKLWPVRPPDSHLSWSPTREGLASRCQRSLAVCSTADLSPQVSRTLNWKVGLPRTSSGYGSVTSQRWGEVEAGG